MLESTNATGPAREGAAPRLLAAFEGVLGIALPVHVCCWDGSEAGPDDGVTMVFRCRRALRHVLWSPNELGLVRAYVSGDLDVEGDLFGLLSLPGLVDSLGSRSLRRLSGRATRKGVWTFLRLGGVGMRPRPPAVELPPTRGGKHRRARDAASVSHHYDVGNDFYRLLLGPTMVYSCGYWGRGERGTLDEAERDKMDLICRKLGLHPGMRLLDVGCGWGSMALHAAQTYGISVVGVTLSHAQLEWGRARVAEAGLEDRVQIRLQDYREIDDGPYDAISSIGMAEHVGNSALPGYAAKMMSLLRPQGRLLNHAIASVRPLAGHGGQQSPFIQRYIFPDGEILPLSRTIDVLERAGFEVRDCEALREHYGLTLRAWVQALRDSWDDAVRLVGEQRARTWLLYLASCALTFEANGQLTIHQVLAVRQDDEGSSGLPRTRAEWLSPQMSSTS